MPDLDYGYKVTISQNATSDPAATTVTNQWQRQVSGNTNWEDIAGGSGESYKIAPDDRGSKIRLRQNLDGANTDSNVLQVTTAEFDKEDGLDDFGDLIGDLKWIGGVLAPNGKIYGIPSFSTTILEIDPNTDDGSGNPTVKTFGNLSGVRKWSGGVLHTNGKIYGIPGDSKTILEIDPNTDDGSGNPTVKTFGSISGSDIANWWGGVLHTNGKIYGIPKNSSTILEIDPNTDDGSGNPTVKTFGSLGSDIGKWVGGVLAPNGKIYGIPHLSRPILEIDPNTDDGSGNPTVKTFGDLRGTYKWVGGVLAPNGKIYGIPQDSQTILEIDPVTRTMRTFGSAGGGYKWKGGVLAPNGKIYGIPYSSSEILEIDPVTQTITIFGNLSDSSKWTGGVLAPNGKIYGIPHNSKTVLEMDFGFPAATGTPGSENWALSGLPGDVLDPRSAYFNKF